MKKIILTEEQITEIIKLYTEELLGSPSIANRLGINKRIVIRTLKDNDIEMGPPGRKFTGGKKVADKRYRENNKDKISENYKKWSDNNKIHLKEYRRKWNHDNKEHVNEYKRNYEKERRANDPKYKLCVRTRTAVYTCLKEANINKYKSTFEVLGYSLDELMNHLENQFTDGMTWDNYGEWHIDHKRPMSSFNFTKLDDPQFKECWALSNLSPLWATDNLSKGSKW